MSEQDDNNLILPLRIVNWDDSQHGPVPRSPSVPDPPPQLQTTAPAPAPVDVPRMLLDSVPRASTLPQPKSEPTKIGKPFDAYDPQAMDRADKLAAEDRTKQTAKTETGGLWGMILSAFRSIAGLEQKMADVWPPRNNADDGGATGLLTPLTALDGIGSDPNTATWTRGDDPTTAQAVQIPTVVRWHWSPEDQVLYGFRRTFKDDTLGDAYSIDDEDRGVMVDLSGFVKTADITPCVNAITALGITTTTKDVVTGVSCNGDGTISVTTETITVIASVTAPTTTPVAKCPTA